MRPGHLFRKSCLISLRRLGAVGLKSSAHNYWASSGFEVCSIMLFTTFSDCCIPIGISQIPVFLFLVPLIIYYPFFWIDIYCLPSVMVHPSSHTTSNDINRDVCIFVKMWICLTCLLRSGIHSVAICGDSIVIQYGSLDFISFFIITGAIVWVACFDRRILSPESAIASMLLLVGLGGVSI